MTLSIIHRGGAENSRTYKSYLVLNNHLPVPPWKLTEVMLHLVGQVMRTHFAVKIDMEGFCTSRSQATRLLGGLVLMTLSLLSPSIDLLMLGATLGIESDVELRWIPSEDAIGWQMW